MGRRSGSFDGYVTAAYSDGSTAAVTDYTTDTSGYNKNKAGNHTITVSYGGKTATFSVNVIDPVKETVATPTVSPTTGTYLAQSVTLTTTTADAKIYYTTDGTEPTTSNTLYTGAISIGVTTTLKAFAVKDGMNDSNILTAVYTIELVIAEWARTVSAVSAVSGTDFNASQFNAVAVDALGNVYAAGYQRNNSSYTYGTGGSAQGTNSSGNNVALVKYDSNGTAQWARAANEGDDIQQFNTVAVDASSNVYAAGSQSGIGIFTYAPGVSAQGTSYKLNVVLVKYDLNGTAQWARTVSAGSYDSLFNAVAVDASGNVYAAGYQRSDGSFNYGSGVSAQGTATGKNNVVLVKYDSNGTAQWAKSVSTGTRKSQFNAVAVNVSGNVYAAGQQEGGNTYGSGVSAQGVANYNVVLVKYRN